MSIAGIRSNRGDIYQTLIAFDWALAVLTDPDYLWLETDSTAYLVDDVVIGRAAGGLICCQCKKNQSDFKSWSIADLADELDKAIQDLTKITNSIVKFYSRSNFGDLAKLCEFSAAYSTEAEYQQNLTKQHRTTDDNLKVRITSNSSNLSTFEILNRISFEVTPNYESLARQLKERLRLIASNSTTGFNALWQSLDSFGGRTLESIDVGVMQHQLTKDDLKNILYKAGAMLVPPMAKAEILGSFSTTSAIGRNWMRDINNQRIPCSLIDDLLVAIEEKQRAILLTGKPGSGKTCIMLGLQESLEKRLETQNDIIPLFIQSREFADITTAQERKALGLTEQWVEQVARLAEEAHVVVIIDSLDVLSIAREHLVLTYFLAQIDKLLLIPNVTVITSCRDFDRQYDRRIAIRQWDSEFHCQPLVWDTEIVPLLEKLNIDSTTIDATTRELITNPRELALFTELAQREGSFNTVTPQALAQRYINVVVVNDPVLSNDAIKVIESIADEMLKSRSLSLPKQRLNTTPDIQRRLLSLNILQDTHDDKVTFGHQTLLDVLVISRAIRLGATLNEFIQGLPPVPFVRPSIRNFVMQLATGDRREYRKQLRAVLSGNAAFHIRRLVAESFVQHIPHDDDWPLIRNLRKNHSDIFQVIYFQALSIEWYQFWKTHLVPTLKDERDTDSLVRHVYRIGLWADIDTEGVLSFWSEALSLGWIDSEKITWELDSTLAKFDDDNLALAAPLITHLLSMPKRDHSSLGHTLARCVTVGILNDDLLWSYIVADVADEDVSWLDIERKIHCQPHDFTRKNNDFLKERMLHSATLIDLALNTIDQWHNVMSTRYGKTRIGYSYGFLHNTSYEDRHSIRDHRHIDDLRHLFDAIEAAIFEHVKTDSTWWLENRNRLCFSYEGSLTYIAIQAIKANHLFNLDIIGQMLCDRSLLEFELSFELSELIHIAFISLSTDVQDLVMANIQSLWNDATSDEAPCFWILKKRAEYVSAIPCHLRSPEIQTILDSYDAKEGKLIREPHICSSGGMVYAPFSYEVFLSAADDGVIQLLRHYTDYDRHFDADLIGGERDVGLQLREASSRQPIRFLQLLSTQWEYIGAYFRNEIIEGIANYLAYRYGRLNSNDNWIPIEKPESLVLLHKILDELEKHRAYWQNSHALAKALNACANIIQNTVDGERLVFLAISFGYLNDESTISGDSIDLLNVGINMNSGNVAEALMILLEKFTEKNITLPETLIPVLRTFASHKHPAIRGLILRHLPFVQNKNPDLGWELFELAIYDAEGLGESAERCLYYDYREHFERVAYFLARIHKCGSEKDMKTWGRISALCALNGQLDFDTFLNNLKLNNVTEAWDGAAKVWTHVENISMHREQCLEGIKVGLCIGGAHSIAVARSFSNIFRNFTPLIFIPNDIINHYFKVLEHQSKENERTPYGFDEWLNAISIRDPDSALMAFEIYLSYIKRAKVRFYDHGKELMQLLTRLFSEAEEREETDGGDMLQSVIALQDVMLSLGIKTVDEWLKAAERP
ncbi:NACHT domain-containing protein [Shewanella livingstonensis]|uniref:AAA family ATPase n=1 Tax=Shewanella livingstonensis TaxID=150120 RepID=A0A3G8LT46_9GAMM|nr:AAA family ATPase [Shewanella livingstonensis]AZG72634.1 AAA family ATPase [Shewanella livingstonensis]